MNIRNDTGGADPALGQEKEQGDTARSIPALFIHNSLKVSMTYSGNKESGLNRKGTKVMEKEEYGLSKIVMTEGTGIMAGKERAV